MTVVLLTCGVLLMVVLGMSVGVIFGRDPIKGSCGGLNKVGIDGECELCGGDLNKCESNIEPAKDEPKTQEGLSYSLTDNKKS